MKATVKNKTYNLDEEMIDKVRRLSNVKTDVYLSPYIPSRKGGQFRQTFFPLLPSTFLSAVVAYELYVNAQDNRTRDLVQEFIRPMERTGVIEWLSPELFQLWFQSLFGNPWPFNTRQIAI